MAAAGGARKDFFISYTGADQAWAQWVAWVLEAAGYSTLIQAWDFHFGDNFVANMHEALEGSERTIALLSETYLASKFCQDEWTAALAKSTPDDPRLLPIRVADVERKGLFAPIASLDLFNVDESVAKDRLLAALNRDRAKPSAPPRFPGAAAGPAQPAPRFPGALPAIWNLERRNPSFTGRSAQLEALRASLRGGNAAAVTQATGITGLGGIGKSQLANEYAYRYRADYDLAWWLRSEDAGTLAADYTALARALDLPEKDAQEQAVVLAAVLTWLQRHDRWLLIFDNAEAPGPLQGLLPRGESGHVIITSRNPNFGGLARVLPLELWPRADSVQFLKDRTGTGGADAEALAHALGDLPLALEQAAAYCQATGESLAGYVAMLTAGHASELFAEPREAERTVAAVWAPSFARVAAESPAGAALLKLISFLAPDAIPLEVISAGAKHVPEPLGAAVTSPVERNKALAALLRYSLIRRDGEMLSVHRLVQAVTRQRLADAEHQAWATAAVSLLDAALPNFPHASYHSDVAAIHDRLAAHLSAAAGYAEGAGVALEAAGRIFNAMGFYRCIRSDLIEAEALVRRGIVIGERAFGANHPIVSERLGSLGGVLQEQGRLAEAEAVLERAIAIGQKSSGLNRPAFATCLNNLGIVVKERGDLAGARDLIERALAIDERAGGPYHPNVARDVGNLGAVLFDQGDVSNAKAAFERALAISEKVFGPNHPRVATHVNNLGSVRHKMGDLHRALLDYQRALAIDENALGPDHPSVARDLNNMGGIFSDLGDRTKAEAALARAHDIRLRTLGPDHPLTKLTHANLARVSGA